MNKDFPAKVFIILLISGILLLLPLAFRGELLQAQEEDVNVVCLDCHDDIAEGLTGSKHELTKPNARGIPVTCVGCHTDYEKHVDDPDEFHPVVSSKLPFAEQADACAKCHLTEHQATMVSTDPHARSQLDCATCHKVHDNRAAGLLVEETQNFCLTCHVDVGAQFRARSAHPLTSGNIRCSDCHSLADRKDHMLATGFDWSCQGCHSEVAGPFLFEHPVAYNHLVQGGGCVECHSPHGSPNDRLLNQPGNGVCVQCHGVPPGHLRAHSGMAAKLNCVDCHSEIHGSNDNRLFLDPMLGVTLYANCYQSGCHGDIR